MIANGDDFPDALSGAPLAASLDAPLLLASRDTLDPAVEDELARLGATTAVLLGGTAVLSEDLEEVLDDAGVGTVERIAGGDRFATAAAIADAFEAEGPTAYLVSGENWPDAVSVASLAAWRGVPLLLTGRDALPDATRNYLAMAGIGSVTVVGGAAVVSDGVLNELDSAGIAATRIAGSERLSTSQAVASGATQIQRGQPAAVAGDGVELPGRARGGPRMGPGDGGGQAGRRTGGAAQGL